MVLLSRDCIDVGIVTGDGGPMLAFYRDVLGFEDEGQQLVSGVGTMFRLRCGRSLVKIIERAPEADVPPGIRYWTLWVADIDVAAAACRAAGFEPIMGPRELRPGLRIAMFTDPDGNWLELAEG